jgi:uncharacterized RDD family membrane protein YckC
MRDPQEVPAARDLANPNASLARRLASLAYESLLASALLLVTGFLTLPLVSPVGPANHALQVPSVPARALSGCVLFGAAGLYCVWMWSGGRRTLPMKTWRLRLVRESGETVDSRAAVIRYLALWIGPAGALVAYEALEPSGLGRAALFLAGLNYAWVLVDPDRQFLHDRIAGTRIVLSDATARP